MEDSAQLRISETLTLILSSHQVRLRRFVHISTSSSLPLMDSMTTDKTESPARNADIVEAALDTTKDRSLDQREDSSEETTTPETEGNGEGEESGEGKKVSMKDREAKLALLRKRFVSLFLVSKFEKQNPSIQNKILLISHIIIA